MSLKRIVTIALFVCLSQIVCSQVREIQCIGESIRKSEILVSISQDQGTIFRIDEDEKSIWMRAATRYAVEEMEWIITENPTSDFYRCEEKTRGSKYVIRIVDNGQVMELLTMTTNNESLQVRMSIVSDREVER